MNRCLLIMSVLTSFWACKTTQKTSQTQKVETQTSTQTSTSSSQTWKMPDFLAQKVKQTDENASIRIQHFVVQGQTYYGYTSCFTCPDNMVQIYNKKGENKANCGGIAGFKGELCQALNQATVVYERKQGKVITNSNSDE